MTEHKLPDTIAESRRHFHRSRAPRTCVCGQRDSRVSGTLNQALPGAVQVGFLGRLSRARPPLTGMGGLLGIPLTSALVIRIRTRVEMKPPCPPDRSLPVGGKAPAGARGGL